MGFGFEDLFAVLALQGLRVQGANFSFFVCTVTSWLSLNHWVSRIFRV